MPSSPSPGAFATPLPPDEVDRLISFALDSLAQVIPYDLASVFQLDGDVLKMRLARGTLFDERLENHSLSLADFPTVARSLESRRPFAFTEDHHAHGEGDPYDGILDLPPGHSCMVVPLFARDRTLGAMTFDRSFCEVYPEESVTLAGVYGEVLGLAMLLAEQGQALEVARKALARENALLKIEARGAGRAMSLLERTRTPKMHALIEQARQVSATDTPVLILGDTGVGKEVLAQAIHETSARRDRPFVKLNGAALSETLVESELFGHVRGAFSGAASARDGRFLTADGGTLLLDELGELPLETQAKLLRVLQEGTFEPVGSDKTVSVDVRVIAATNVDLERAVAAGKFRKDLFYRLSVFPLKIPPLHERSADIPELAAALLEGLHRRSGRGPWSLTSAASAELKARAWPGNVRELQNVLERATIVGGSRRLTPADFPSAHTAAWSTAMPAASVGTSPDQTFVDCQREYFSGLLTRSRGKVYGPGGAAELADLKPSTLQARLAKLGLNRGDFL